MFKHSSRKRPSKDSTKALSLGLPGRLYSNATLFSYARRSSAFEMNSGPLSTSIWRMPAGELEEVVTGKLIQHSYCLPLIAAIYPPTPKQPILPPRWRPLPRRQRRCEATAHHRDGRPSSPSLIASSLAQTRSG